jgi:osmotically-inducible protein OsmY
MSDTEEIFYGGRFSSETHTSSRSDLMSGDMQLKQHVEDELSWEPSVDTAAIGVAVKDAIVTLSGHVASFGEKRAAEQVVMRIRGVRALVNEIEVKFLADSGRTDEDIAHAAVSVLNWNSAIPENSVKIKVAHGWITLEGAVDWNYQRLAAERLTQDLMGVKGVTNLLTLKTAPVRADVKQRIESALKRNAELDARDIQVTIQGNRVILSGATPSIAERLAAECAAWRGAGVNVVENSIVVKPGLVHLNVA